MTVKLLTVDTQHSVLRNSYVKLLNTIHNMVAHPSVASCKPKVELDSHTDMCVVGDNYLVIHDHNIQSMFTVMIKSMMTEVPRKLMPH